MYSRGSEVIAVPEPFAMTVRKFIVLLVVLCLGYFLIWLPWRNSRTDFLLFFGCGMIQLAATYTHDLRKDPANYVLGPILFLNPFMYLFVSALAFVGLIFELTVGFNAKPWWEALLLPIPPFAFASVWYKRHNPVLPFFTGIIALVVALLLKFLA